LVAVIDDDVEDAICYRLAVLDTSRGTPMILVLLSQFSDVWLALSWKAARIKEYLLDCSILRILTE